MVSRDCLAIQRQQVAHSYSRVKYSSSSDSTEHEPLPFATMMTSQTQELSINEIPKDEVWAQRPGSRSELVHLITSK